MMQLILNTELPAATRTLLLREKLATAEQVTLRYQGGRDLLIIHECGDPLPQDLTYWLVCAQGCGLVGQEIITREEL